MILLANQTLPQTNINLNNLRFWPTKKLTFPSLIFKYDFIIDIKEGKTCRILKILEQVQ